MGKRRMKLSAEERIEIVESYLRQEISLTSAAKEAQVNMNTVRRWCALYENEGWFRFFSFSISILF